LVLCGHELDGARWTTWLPLNASSWIWLCPAHTTGADALNLSRSANEFEGIGLMKSLLAFAAVDDASTGVVLLFGQSGK
jgi:hypothetical protein